MLTREENELLCRIGPDRPMGRMMRRYWLPAILSEELVPNGDPKRVRLLGENLVAWRDADGRAGLLDENCPHRGASLALARSEECGLRCLYHGWKIAVDGSVLETPPEPDEYDFRSRVRARAYEVHEAGGVVWAYMGPPGEAPPHLDFEFCALPESQRMWMKARIDCNWTQGIEGVLDNAHVAFLHADTIRPATGVATTVFDNRGRQDRPSNDLQPKMEAQNTAYGFRYASIRKPTIDPETQRYVRVTLFVAPFYGIFPAPAGWGNMQAFVPIDDEHTMLFFTRFKYDGPITEEERDRTYAVNGFRPGIDLGPDYTKLRNRDNQWLQDRAAMHAGRSTSGIAGVNTEDMAVQESMGAVYDRSKEHVGTTDLAVIRMRRLLIDAAKRFDTEGAPALGLAEPVPYARLRAEERIIGIDEPWETVGAFAGEPVTPAKQPS
jgi:phthalate 4,5-dioxygenase oxygenase subunit